MRCHSLILGKDALITGAVVAEIIVVRGCVTGPVCGRKVTLKAGSRVTGDIICETLALEKGAVFAGVSYPADLSRHAPGNSESWLTALMARGRGRAANALVPPREKSPDRVTDRIPATPSFTFGWTAQARLPALLGSGLRSVSRFVDSLGATQAGPPAFLVQTVRPRRRRRRRFRVASPALNLVAFVSAGALLGWTYALPRPVDRYPLARTLEAPTERELIIQTADGKPFARRGGCFDVPVTLDEVPSHFVDALLAMEDRRFTSHFGIDPGGILRAAFHNYNAGRVSQGGSTITQQLAKISYLSGEKTLLRKLEEAVIALRLELALSKPKILERYLSRVYFGESCYGLRGAARHYFGRKVSDLTIAESAYLVALLKSPATLANNLPQLRQREALVLDAMVEDGRLEPDKRKRVEPAELRPGRDDPFGAYFADWIADTVEQPDDGALTALPVRTSFEPRLQLAAEEAVAKVVGRSGKRRHASQAALVAMRPDGRVLAMVGGVDHGHSQFNRATQALRQPGSSFKSFVYLAALRAGGRPDMLIMDEPVVIGDYSPENYTRSHSGVVTLQKAFASSINTVAVRLSEAVGRERVATAARDLGITTPLHGDPSIALGTAEVTLLELTSAYAAFSANAYPVIPWGITALGAKPSRTARPPQGAGKWRLGEAAQMREFLGATVAYGTGRGAQLPIPAYGKTGTSQSYRDAWFVGFAGNLVVGVWVGNDDNAPMLRVTGGNLPAQIWKHFMSRAQYADRDFKRRLPDRIAGFRAARPPRQVAAAQAYDLQALLLSDSRYVTAGQGFANRVGRPMALGYPVDAAPHPPRYRGRTRRPRTLRSIMDQMNRDGS